MRPKGRIIALMSKRQQLVDFFTAQRSISPLVACSLLVTAGFIAGSLNLVAPNEPQSLTAQAAAPTPTAPAPSSGTASGAFKSNAPQDCDAAFKAAIENYEKNKDPVGPFARNEDRGQAGTLDKCYGAILKPAPAVVDSSPDAKTWGKHKSHFNCVGRSGTVSIDNIKVLSVTVPDPTIPPGICQVKVCKTGGTCVSAERYQGLNSTSGGGYGNSARVDLDSSTRTFTTPGANGTEPLPDPKIPPPTGPQPDPTASPVTRTGTPNNPCGPLESGCTSGIKTPPPGGYCDESLGGCFDKDGKPVDPQPPTDPNTAKPPKLCDPGSDGCANVPDPKQRADIKPPPPPPNPRDPRGPGFTGPNDAAGACQGNPTCPGRTSTFTKTGGDDPVDLRGGGGGGASGIMNGIGSFLTGLARGFLGGSGGSGGGQQCPTNQQAFAQYQQQYNAQLQQYNYQMQQYNYQAQVDQYNRANGYYNYSTPIQMPTPPQPCQPGSGSSGGSGSGGSGGGYGYGTPLQCPQPAAQPNAASCSLGSWQQKPTTLAAGLVCPVWQCVPNDRPQPTAQLSCEPGVADEGTTVTISYTCAHAATSTGYGFTTNGALSGATTTTITNPPENATALNFSLRCASGTVSAAAQCSVQLARSAIVVRAVPNTVVRNGTTTIGWVATGARSCTVSSPDQQDFTARNADRRSTTGAAVTSPITKDGTVFYVTCETATGQRKVASTTVSMRVPGTVTSNLEGQGSVVHGSNASIQWNFPEAPESAAVGLWLVDTEERRVIGLIAANRAKRGSFTWTLPEPSSACDRQLSWVCGYDLAPGRTYLIQASVYTPANAQLGQFIDSSLPEATYIETRYTRQFRMSGEVQEGQGE
jgi:hypothetical protein